MSRHGVITYYVYYNTNLEGPLPTRLRSHLLQLLVLLHKACDPPVAKLPTNILSDATCDFDWARAGVYSFGPNDQYGKVKTVLHSGTLSATLPDHIDVSRGWTFSNNWSESQAALAAPDGSLSLIMNNYFHPHVKNRMTFSGRRAPEVR